MLVLAMLAALAVSAAGEPMMTRPVAGTPEAGKVSAGVCKAMCKACLSCPPHSDVETVVTWQALSTVAPVHLVVVTLFLLCSVACR